MRTVRIALCVLTVCLVALAGACTKGTKNEIQIKQGLAARIGDVKITEEELEWRYEQLPEPQRKDFKGPQGKALFADRLIEERLLALEAVSRKLDENPEVARRIETARLNILIAEYYQREIRDRIEISDEEIQRFYEENIEEFTPKPVTRAQYALTSDSLKAVEWLRRARAGENFTKICTNESEDKVVAAASGDLGYFNSGGYIKSIGISGRFTEGIKDVAVGKFSEVFRFEKGFAVVRITERNPAPPRALADVRAEIEDQLRGRKAKEKLDAEIASLKEKHKPENYVREAVEQAMRTPQEYWEAAQLESDPVKRIQYYRDLATKYPADKYAPQALFMIGFVYSEDFKDVVQARRTFDELISKYPESDMVESARWMIDNMSKPHEKIESLEGVQEKMRESAPTPAGKQ